MRNKYIENFEKAQVAEKSLPAFRAGDTVRLAVTIKEGDKSRVQAYESLECFSQLFVLFQNFLCTYFS